MRYIGIEIDGFVRVNIPSLISVRYLQGSGFQKNSHAGIFPETPTLQLRERFDCHFAKEKIPLARGLRA